MLAIYHSPRSRSLRVLWLAEELGLSYETRNLGMFTDDLKRPEYLRIHPLGKVPAIDDDGFVLWETAAIFQYLDGKYGGGALLPPPHTPEGALASQWMLFGENPLTVIMGEIAAHGGAMPEEMRIPALAERGRELAPALVRVAERALEEGPYVLGDRFSAADITLHFGLNIARHLGFVDAASAAAAYCDLLDERPAYQRALSR